MYNFGPGVIWSGLANYADGINLFFEDKKYTLKD